MQKKNEERDDLCYNCKKPDHFRDDCPNPPARKYNDDERRQRRDQREKTRAFAAKTEKGKEKACTEGTDSSDISSTDTNSSDSDNEALICLMANEDEVFSESDTDLDFSDMSNMFTAFEKMSKLHAQLKEENSRLKSESGTLTEKLNVLSSQCSELDKLKSNFNDLSKENEF